MTPGTPSVAVDLFNALIAEPNTGVGVVTLDGTCVYMNTQLAKILIGPDAKADDYVGRSFGEYMPEEWVAERLKILTDMAQHGKAVLLRVIWRGYQHFTWIYPIAHDPAELLAEGQSVADTEPMLVTAKQPLFLTITRRVSSDEEAEQLVSPGDYEQIDSNVMKLGKLDALSDRELQVLALLGQGLSIRETARILHLSEKTVDHHRMSIHTKMQVHDRVALAEIVRRAGLTLGDVNRARV